MRFFTFLLCLLFGGMVTAQVAPNQPTELETPFETTYDQYQQIVADYDAPCVVPELATSFAVIYQNSSTVQIRLKNTETSIEIIGGGAVHPNI